MEELRVHSSDNTTFCSRCQPCFITSPFPLCLHPLSILSVLFPVLVVRCCKHSKPVACFDAGCRNVLSSREAWLLENTFPIPMATYCSQLHIYTETLGAACRQGLLQVTRD